MFRGVAVAGVRVGKATGVVYLPGLGFMCSPGGRVLGTQPPLVTYVVNRTLLQRINHFCHKLAEISFFIISDQNLVEHMMSSLG